MKHVLVMWDQDTDHPAQQINNALFEVFDGKNCPCVVEVMTGSDMFGVIVASELIIQADAQMLYEKERDAAG